MTHHLRSVLLAAIAALVPVYAAADVTVVQKMTGGMMGVSGGAESIVYVKGPKMRTDGQAMGQSNTTIIDLDAQRMIVLHPSKREAEIHDLSKMSAMLQKNVNLSNVKADLTPSGQTRQILGRECKGYTFSVNMPMAMAADVPISMTMKGTVWVAEGAPGAADYAKFYAAATEKGFLFSSPQGGQGRGAVDPNQGMTALYKALAATNGIPYLMETNIQIDASGPMAEMMKRIAPQGFTNEVTRVSTDALSDDLFAVPAGFTTRNR